jgi:cobalamin biosynthesis protein CobC
MDARLHPFAEHGGRLSAARALFGGSDWLDLSTGIAPWSYPASFVGCPLSGLPESGDLEKLEEAAALAFGVPRTREVVAVPGTDLALRLLALIVPTSQPARLEPCYPGHRASWPDARPLDSGPADLLILANPNNPDGRCFSGAELRELASDKVLIVDEAYADASPGLSVADATWAGLIVLRSFGKFFGLAGLRLGFVIAESELSRRLRALLGDWPISAPALAVGAAAYADASWQEQQRARIAEAGRNLETALAAAGVRTIGATPYFRLIEAGDAHAVFDHLACTQILTRPFDLYPDRLRVGLPSNAQAAERLAAALQGAFQ